jgi:hypothetical protein
MSHPATPPVERRMALCSPTRRDRHTSSDMSRPAFKSVVAGPRCRDRIRRVRYQGDVAAPDPEAKCREHGGPTSATPNGSDHFGSPAGWLTPAQPSEELKETVRGRDEDQRHRDG